MKLTVFILHCFLLFIRLKASLVEKSSLIDYISFNAEQVSSNFIPGISNNIFINHIFPYLDPFPPHFIGLPYVQGNKYQLINKDWTQIIASISDYCRQNSQSLSNIVYAKFKSQYGNMSILDFKNIIYYEVQDNYRCFMLCMRPFIEDIIKKNYLSGDDANLLYYCLIRGKMFSNIRLPDNIVDRLEQVLYDEIEINKYNFDQVFKFFLSEPLFEIRPQSHYYKFLSFKRIIVCLWRQKKPTVLPFLCVIFFGFLYVYENLPKKDLCASLFATYAFLHLSFSGQIPFHLFHVRFF